MLRHDYVANRVFNELDATIRQAELELKNMAANKSATKSFTNWLWIRDILNA